MGLIDELGFDAGKMRETLGVGHDHTAPVEAAPTAPFERQVLNSAPVWLLQEWVERLAREIDELKARDAAG